MPALLHAIRIYSNHVSHLIAWFRPTLVVIYSTDLALCCLLGWSSMAGLRVSSCIPLSHEGVDNWSLILMLLTGDFVALVSASLDSEAVLKGDLEAAVGVYSLLQSVHDIRQRNRLHLGRSEGTAKQAEAFRSVETGKQRKWDNGRQINGIPHLLDT